MPTKYGSVLHGSFAYLISNTYISNIYNIYNPDENSSLESQTIRDHMFSDRKWDHTSHVFGFSTWLIFCFFSYVDIFHLLRR